MKSTQIISIFLLAFLVLYTSCTFEKRMYTKGYHVARIHQKGNSVTPHKIAFKTRAKNNSQKYENSLTASAEKSNMPAAVIVKPLEISNTTDLISNLNIALLDEECDVIVFKTGDEVKAKIFEITPNDIKYKPCDFLDGPMRTVRKSDVFMLKYANGTKEVFSTNNPTPSSNAQPQSSTNSSNQNSSDQSPTNKKTHPLAILSFIISIVGLFVAGIPLGLAAVIFGALSLKKIGLAPDRFKGKGFAIAAIVIGVLAIIGAAIAISMI